MIVAQHGNFTIVATHGKLKATEAKVATEGGEKKEGEPEKKEKEA